MIRRCLSVAPATLLLPLLLTGHTGGWATITVEHLPDYVVANQEFNLAFTVRQHGVSPMNDLKPVVLASAGKLNASMKAIHGDKPGQYVVAMKLPEPGDWKVTVQSGFGPSNLTLMPLRATGAGAMDRPNFTAAERGKRLFVAKGCVMCHMRQDVEGSGKLQMPNGSFIVHKVGPDLTEPRLSADYLARFLADPSIKPPTNPSLRMPNLQLAPNEITALIAFLNGEVNNSELKNGAAKKDAKKGD